MTLPVIAAPKGRMTEAEARRVGQSANRIAQLRSLRDNAKRGGSITGDSGNGAASHALTAEETKACLALLIEREETFLTSFDIELEETPQ